MTRKLVHRFLTGLVVFLTTMTLAWQAFGREDFGTLYYVACEVSAKEPTSTRKIVRTIHAVQAATDQSAPLYDGPDGRTRTAMLLLQLGWHESRWTADALGRDGEGGVVQVLWPEQYGFRRQDVRRSLVLGFRAGIAELLVWKRVCGETTLRWLGGYAAGRCGAAVRTASRRCELFGNCDWR